MNQKRVYKTYTQEFKKEAVALVMDQGYSVAEAARSLGVNANLLYKWKEQQEAQARAPSSLPLVSIQFVDQYSMLH